MGTKHQIFQSFFDPVKRDPFCTSASSLYVNSGRRNKSIRSSPSQRIFLFLASISPDVVNAPSFQWDANVHDQDKIKLDILYITTIKVSFQKCDFRPPISTKNFQFAWMEISSLKWFKQLSLLIVELKDDRYCGYKIIAPSMGSQNLDLI